MTRERAALVLVDLDNVHHRLADDGGLEAFMPSSRPSEGLDWLRGGDDVGAPAVISGTPDCVVAYAFNTDTAAAAPPGIEARLQKAACHVAHFVAGAAAVGCEFGLTLSNPQAADALLQRLITETPHEEHAFEFDRVFLLSWDTGLRDVTYTLLGKRWETPPESKRFWGLTCWTTRDSPKRRRFNAGKAHTCAAKEVSPEASHVRASEPALAVWAASQTIDLVTETRLDDIANACRQWPGIHTQLSPTTSSLRGMARFQRLVVLGKRLVGPCMPIDGLELRCRGSSSIGKYEQAEPSSLGPGAVRALKNGDRMQRTLRAEIPYVLMARAAPFVVEVEGLVEKWRSLRMLARDTSQPTATCDGHVDLTARDGGRDPDLIAAVRTKTGTAPAVWWVAPKQRTNDRRAHEAMRRILRAGRLLAGSVLDNIAIWCRVVNHAEPRVVLRAPLLHASVEVPSRIPPDQLGLGIAGEHRVAVLTGQRPVARGTHACIPIQDVMPATYERTHPGTFGLLEELCDLPIVVPAGPP